MSIAVNVILTMTTVVVVSAVFLAALKLVLRLITPPATKTKSRSHHLQPNIAPGQTRHSLARSSAGRHKIAADLLLDQIYRSHDFTASLEEAQRIERTFGVDGQFTMDTSILNPDNTSIDTTGVYFGTKFNMSEPHGFLGLGGPRLHDYL